MPCGSFVVARIQGKSKNRFLSFDEQPIAAASIAQVHHAVLRDHQEVAIKVQYPGIEHKMRLDTTIMSFLSKAVTWVRFESLNTNFFTCCRIFEFDP
ncbi:hypothetical protein Pint_18274 [Pistacia integerrima]|uniref:Uncharacterized protein n=1 Tax=Pistacia integerrima TaxID=434235 RepID=A0ACC0YY09_9ROSI|nr:hypothetical protein Pint_18274 [Pistacia integerrima]